MKNFKTMRNGVLIVAIFFCTISSSFANYSCQGKVTGVTISPDGQLFAETIGSLSWSRLCSVSKLENNVPPEACRVIYNVLLTAQITNKDVGLSFNDSGNCSSHEAWEWLTGWYLGPSLK